MYSFELFCDIRDSDGLAAMARDEVAVFNQVSWPREDGVFRRGRVIVKFI